MNTGTSKSCSKCKKDILCQANAIEICACSNVTISKECTKFLTLTQYDCLCNDCLIQVNALVAKADTAPQKLTENIHYYLENGLLVFTELNHIQRGYCCKSNCRHCAYGYK